MDVVQFSSSPKGHRGQRGFTLIEIMAQGLKVLAERPADASASNWRSYLERLPNDPWGKPYQYLNPGVNGEIDVFSLGADGQPGGEGINADIGSWQL
ncbi:type II secretion system protein GspG [Pseudomonas aeruginosa]|uniref:type II secretion system protein GspG n=1 Tax=Pseudomonas aeruginosa TaxID=287 RepID=UPI00104D4A62|nr:type II secretion system protein GspG [Pseudomonas aeruginosa]